MPSHQNQKVNCSQHFAHFSISANRLTPAFRSIRSHRASIPKRVLHQANTSRPKSSLRYSPSMKKGFVLLKFLGATALFSQGLFDVRPAAFSLLDKLKVIELPSMLEGFCRAFAAEFEACSSKISFNDLSIIFPPPGIIRRGHRTSLPVKIQWNLFLRPAYRQSCHPPTRSPVLPIF